jgi:hypothetical protein
MMDDYQSVLLNIAINELTSHGVMLFAVLTSSVAFLRIINDYYKNRCYKIPKTNNVILWIFLSTLFGLSFYVVIKLVFWARVLSSATYLSQTPKHISFVNYTRAVYAHARGTLQDNPYEKLVFYSFLPRGKFPHWRIFVMDLGVGGLISFWLMYALSNFSIKKWIRETWERVVRMRS